MASILFGAWLGAWPTGDLLTAFQSKSCRPMNLVHLFVVWETPFSTIQPHLDPVYLNGSRALITWQPDGIDTTLVSVHAAYITRFADDIKAYGRPILLRPMHEMNGNWYAWGIGGSSINTNETYIAAWKFIVSIFRQSGATNARFVWCINESNWPHASNATFTGAYPGDDYVDFVAIDGYNWGTTIPSCSFWRSFHEVFSPAYHALIGLTRKPILISEWASTEQGGDKTAWMSDAFHHITTGTFPQIAGLIWFNENKETDWRIESSPAAQLAYCRNPIQM